MSPFTGLWCLIAWEGWDIERTLWLYERPLQMSMVSRKQSWLPEYIALWPCTPSALKYNGFSVFLSQTIQSFTKFVEKNINIYNMKEVICENTFHNNVSNYLMELIWYCKYS